MRVWSTIMTPPRSHLQSSGLEPNVLILGTDFAAAGDNVASHLHPTSDFFQSCSGNPSRGMLRVSGDDRLEQ